METNNRYFLPSEIARLVLGYLQTESYSSSYKSFLKECPHLEEYAVYLRRGQSYPLTINGFTLIQMLEEYAGLKITDAQRRQHDPSVGSLWRQFDSVVQCLKAQTTSKFLRVDGKTQNARMRTQRIIYRRGQNEINIKNTSEKDDTSKETEVSKGSHVKSENATVREIEGVSGFTETSASTLSSRLHHNIVDSTSCDSDPHVDSTSIPDINNDDLQPTFETVQLSHMADSQTFDTTRITQTSDLQGFDAPRMPRTSSLQTFDTSQLSRTTDPSEQINYTAPRSVDSKVYDKRYCDSKGSVFMNLTTSDSIDHDESPRLLGDTAYHHANSVPPSPVMKSSHVNYHANSIPPSPVIQSSLVNHHGNSVPPSPLIQSSDLKRHGNMVPPSPVIQSSHVNHHGNSVPPSPVIQSSHVKSTVCTNQSSSGHADPGSPAVISDTKINSQAVVISGNSQALMPSLNNVQSSGEISIVSSPAAISNKDIQKGKSSVTDIPSILTTVVLEKDIGSSCTTATATDKLSKLLENKTSSVTFDTEIDAKADTDLCDDKSLNSSLVYHDKLGENQQNQPTQRGDVEMTVPVKVIVKQLAKGGSKNTSDIHKSPRRKRPPRKRSADIKADRKLHFTEHNESSNSTEDGSTVTQDDSLPTIIYEHLLKSTQLQELLAENINKQLHQDVSKHLPSSADTDASKEKMEDDVPDPVIDKNPFTPSQSLEDILDPQETQMTSSQINDIIEMTSNDPVFDSLFNLFEIDKNSYSDHSDEKDTSHLVDQNKEVEKWINSDDVQNSTYDQSFHDLHTSLSQSQTAGSSDTSLQNKSVSPCTASSSAQPTDVQILRQYGHANTPYAQMLPPLPVVCSMANTALPHLTSVFITPSVSSATYSSASIGTSSETVLVQSISPGFPKVQSTVTKSSHGFPVLSLKSLSNSDEDDNDVTDFPMDVSEIATPNISTLSVPSQISMTSPPYSVTSSQVLTTSAGSTLVTSTTCNVSSVSSTRENKSNNSYLSFVNGMELNQNSSTPVCGGRTQGSNILDNSLAFLGLPTHVNLEATSSQKTDILEDKNNSKQLCTEKDEIEKKKTSPSGKEKSPCKTRSTSTWSACLTALMQLASPDKKQNYETLVQNMGEKPSTGKAKAKRTRSTKKSKPAKPVNSSQTAVSVHSGSPASSKSNCKSQTVTSTQSCASKTSNDDMDQKSTLSMPVDFLTTMGTSSVITGSSDIGSNSLTIKSNPKNFAQNSEQMPVVKKNSRVQSSETGRRSKGSRKKKLGIAEIRDIDFLNSSNSEEEITYSPTTLEKEDSGVDEPLKKAATKNDLQITEKSVNAVPPTTDSHNTTLTSSTETSLDKSEIIYTAIPIGKAKPKDVHVRSLDFGEVDVLGLNKILSNSSKRKFASKTRPKIHSTYSPGQMTRQLSIGRGRKCTNKKDHKNDPNVGNCPADLDKSSLNLDKSSSNLDKSSSYLDESSTTFDKNYLDSDYIPDAAGNVFVFEKKFVKLDQAKVTSCEKGSNQVTSQMSNPAERSCEESSDHFDDELPDPSLPPIILSKSGSNGTRVEKANNRSSSKLSPLVNAAQVKVVNNFSQDLFTQTEQSCSQISGVSSLSQNPSPYKIFELSPSNSINKNTSFNEGIKSHDQEVKPLTVNRVYGQFSDISDNSMSNHPADGTKKSVNNKGISLSSESHQQQSMKSKIDSSRRSEHDADRNIGILGLKSVSNDSFNQSVKNVSRNISASTGSETTSMIRNSLSTTSTKKKNNTVEQSNNDGYGTSKIDRNHDMTLVQITDSHGKNLTIPAGYETKLQTSSLSESCIGQNDMVSSEDEVDIEGDWENPWENTCDTSSNHQDRTLVNSDDTGSNKTIPADENGSSDSAPFYYDNSCPEVSKINNKNMQMNSRGSDQICSGYSKQSVCDSSDKNIQIVDRYQNLSSDSNSNSLTMNSLNKLVNSVSQLCSRSNMKVHQNKEIAHDEKMSKTVLVRSSPQSHFLHQERGNVVVISDDSDSMPSRHGNRKSRPGSSTKSADRNANSCQAGETLKSPSVQFSTVSKATTATPNKTVPSVEKLDQNKLSFQSYRDHTEDSHSRASVDSHQSDSTQSVSSHCSYQSAGSINMAAMMMTPPKKRITASMKSGTGLYFISRQSSKTDNTGTKLSPPKSHRTPKKRLGTPDKNKLARRSPRLIHGTRSPIQHSKLSRRPASSPAPSYSSVKENSSPNSKSVDMERQKVLNVLPKQSSSVIGHGGQKRQREDSSVLSPQSPVKKKVKKTKKPYDMANLDIEKFLTKIYNKNSNQ